MPGRIAWNAPPSRATAKTRRRESMRLWRIPVVLATVGLLSTGIAVQATRVNLQRVRSLEFDGLARDVRTAIEGHIAVNTEVLFGLRTLHAAKRPLGRDDFRRYVSLSDVLRRYPGVRAVSFNRFLRRAEVRRFEEKVRRDTSLNRMGYPRFRVHPESKAADLIVVDYIEPLEGNEAAFGFDVGSNPTRRAAIEEARDSGDAVATAPIQLVQGVRGFLLFLPVYDSDFIPVTAPARRRRFEGVMTVVYGADALLSGVLGAHPNVRVEEIYDVGPTVESESGALDANGLLVDAGGGVSALDPDSIPDLHRFLDLDVGSRRWRMLATAPAGFAAGAERLFPWLVGVAGSMVSLLLAGLVLSIAVHQAQRHERALRHAAELERTVEVLERTDEDRRRLLARLVATQEEERARIAAYIHDDSIQVMTGAGMRLHTLRRHISDPVQLERLSQLQVAVEESIARLRSLLFELRPGALDEQGLAAALGAYLTETMPESGIEFHLDDRLAAEPPEDVRVMAYRIAQEALMNVRKHSRAKHVDVLLDETDGGILIRIADDGTGFSPQRARRAALAGHLGLPLLQERAQMAGGRIRIESTGEGTAVDLWLPYGRP